MRISLSRHLLLTTLAVLALSATAIGSIFVTMGYRANNSAASMPPDSTLAESRDRAIAWIRHHEAEVIATENPVLWWMVKESAARSGDAYLADLYGRYYDRYLAHNRGNVWHHLFDADAQVQIHLEALAAWPDYNLLFLYGLSCRSELRHEPRVVALLDANACGGFGTPAYFRDPTCLTHQLMGVRFMQEHRCQSDEKTKQLTGTLVEQVVDSTRLDFRVVDFYIQRLLMLAESGAASRIEPRWLIRVLDAQRPDGGWDDFDRLIGLGERSLGWSGRSLRLRTPASNFHTTAQGLYLMSLLTQTGRTGLR